LDVAGVVERMTVCCGGSLGGCCVVVDSESDVFVVGAV